MRRISGGLIVMVTPGRGAFGDVLFGLHTKNVLGKSKMPLVVRL